MMRLSIFLSLFLSALCFSTPGFADVKDQSTGLSFPSEISFQQDGKEYKLKATGVSTRKKFFVKVYSVASYLQEDAANGDILQAILNDKNAKQLTIKWAHEAPLKKLQEGYHESLRSVVPPQQYAKIEKDVDTYIGFFKQTINVGDEQIIRWLPDGTVILLLNGKEAGTIKNPEFAAALLNVWFGDRSVVNRGQLTSIK